MHKEDEIAEILINKMAGCITGDNIAAVNTKEYGEVADIYKDLYKAKYYKLLCEAMEKEGTEETLNMYNLLNAEAPAKYYTVPGVYRLNPRDAEMDRDIDISKKRMYYTEMPRDEKEGKAYKSRKTYMETKEIHAGNTEDDRRARAKDTENYIADLTDDIMEMYHNAMPEERQAVKNKLTQLLQKI